METPEIEAGSTFSLVVNIGAFNLALTDITWSYNEANFMSGQDRITITSPSFSTLGPVSSTLERTSVIPLDAGEYTVSATNPAGSSNFTFQVSVTGKILLGTLPMVLKCNFFTTLTYPNIIYSQ